MSKLKATIIIGSLLVLGLPMLVFFDSQELSFFIGMPIGATITIVFLNAFVHNKK